MFNERLKEERIRLGLTQLQVCEIAGIVTHTLIQYEKGKRVPDLLFLERLGNAGFDVLYIITGKHTPKEENSLSDEEARVVKNYKAASAKNQEAAQVVLDALAKLGNKAA